MAKFSAIAEAAAGSATLPFAGVYADASNGIVVREIKVFTTAANAARIRISRSTTAGTWTALTEKAWGDFAVVGSAVHTSSVAPTFDADPLDQGMVAAAIGSGFVYTYYGEGNGLFIPKGTANGIILIEEVDTANTYDVTLAWDPA